MGVSAEKMVGVTKAPSSNTKPNHHHHHHNHVKNDVNVNPPTKFNPENPKIPNPNKKVKFLDQIQEYVIAHPGNNEEIHQRDDVEEDVNEIEEEEEDELGDDADAIGEVVRVSVDDDGNKRNHYKGFLFDGNRFHLEDSVLVSPEEGQLKPSVAIIKDVFQSEGKSLTVRGLRYFRPEEAERKGGGTRQSRDARELYYSCYYDEFLARNVMHKCVIHMIPVGKPVPDRKQHPGFIVQKVYDFKRLKLRDLTDCDCDCEGI